MNRIGLAALILFTSSVNGAEPTSKELYQAIRQNDLPRLRAMVDSSATANLRDSRGVTPLMYASAAGTADAMKILIEAGSDVNAKSGLDATALLWGAVDLAKTRMLIDAGANVNAKSKIGRTPLIVAAGRSGSADTVRLLLSKGADGKIADATGSTALVEAAHANDLETIRLLLPAKPDINAGDLIGNSALMWAAGNSNLAAVKLLLASGADVNASHIREIQMKNGLIAVSKITPLMAVAARRSPEVAAALLEAGAEVNAKDIRGMTPLMFAVASDVADPRVVTLLLDRKADREIKSRDGETALDWARKFGNPEVLRLLGGLPIESKVAVKPAAFSKNDPAAAISRAIPLLQTSANEFFKQSGCIGCHHQNLSGVAVAAATRKGIRADEKSVSDQRLLAKTELTRERESVLQGIFISTDGLIYSLVQLAEQNYPADEITDALVAAIASHQSADGKWSGLTAVRPPLEDSNVLRTAMAIRALDHYRIPARKAEFDERIAKAREWLVGARNPLPYERSFQLLGLKWSGAGRGELDRVANEVRRLQRVDGGWSQLPTLQSDAYATGVALYALTRGGTSPKDSVYQRGVGFLLASQKPDGSWYVASRSPKFQPYFQSGFPYNHDQWISSAATSWAAAALAEVLDPAQSSASLR